MLESVVLSFLHPPQLQLTLLSWRSQDLGLCSWYLCPYRCFSSLLFVFLPLFNSLSPLCRSFEWILSTITSYLTTSLQWAISLWEAIPNLSSLWINEYSSSHGSHLTTRRVLEEIPSSSWRLHDPFPFHRERICQWKDEISPTGIRGHLPLPTLPLILPNFHPLCSSSLVLWFHLLVSLGSRSLL
jgi:hypothetical protein